MSCGDNQAGRQALDVPLPWRRQSFVEIIDVEENVALWSSETAEIHEVSVAAGLHADPGCRGRSQIGGHQGGRAPIEGEGRLGHSPETDRDQPRDAPFVGLSEEINGVASFIGRLPAAVSRPRRGVAQRPSRGSPLFDGFVSVTEARGSGRGSISGVRLTHMLRPLAARYAFRPGFVEWTRIRSRFGCPLRLSVIEPIDCKIRPHVRRRIEAMTEGLAQGAALVHSDVRHQRGCRRWACDAADRAVLPSDLGSSSIQVTRRTRSALVGLLELPAEPRTRRRGAAIP